jgi:hypothetical protein
MIFVLSQLIHEDVMFLQKAQASNYFRNYTNIAMYYRHVP